MEKKTTIIDDPTAAVLIVDDSVHYAKVLQRMLGNGLGFSDITVVDNTAAALTLVQENPEKFKILFVDYNFPQGDTGGQFIEKLKAQNLMNGKVVFLITSEPTTENMKQATQAGAAGVVAKPFNSQQLLAQLDKAKRTLFAESVDYF
jgi:CheY-like chemotaxis protein